MKNKFIMLVGIPGSGKSTYADFLQERDGFTVHSSDAIRKELSGSISDQSLNNKVFNLIHKRIIDDLKLGKNVIYDATNMSRRRREGFLRNLERVDCEKVCRVIAPSVETCKERNLGREFPVPEAVIERMANSFQIPVIGEGWDSVELTTTKKEYDFEEMFNRMIEMPHENPNHTFSVGKHMLEAYEHADEDLKVAALVHDFGKLVTKELKDKDGNPSDVARYYGHDSRGTYELLSKFFGRPTRYNDINIVIDEEVLILVQYHMYPFLHWTENHQVKWKKLLGEEIFEKLFRLHKADRKAH